MALCTGGFKQHQGSVQRYIGRGWRGELHIVWADADGISLFRQLAQHALGILLRKVIQRQHVHSRGANKFRHKHSGRTGVDLHRGAHLLDLTSIEHHEPIPQRHRLELVVGHIEAGGF